MLKSNFSRALFLLATCPLAGFAQTSKPQTIVNGEYIVKFKAKTSVNSGMKVVSRMGASVKVKSVFAGSNMMHVKINSQSARDALYADPSVEFVEPNYLLSVNPMDVSALGSAPSPSDSYSQSNSNVQVRDSWNIQKPYDQGSKIVVAVIDTGLDKNHLVFKDSGSVWENTAEKNGLPGVDDDGNGYIDDVNGWNFVSNSPNAYDDNDHGTHVAGIILGVGQDVLANPVRESKVTIMPLKFLDSAGSGSTSSAVTAIYYAVNKGAKVINNSWGGPSYSQSLHEAYTYAYNHGVVIVSAAGNSNTNNDASAMYPANIDSPNNISVLATTDSDAKASFSSYGATTVNVGAPGVAILSTVPGTGCLAPGCFQMMSGTSMATPFVAGLAALVFREAPQLSAYQVRSIILGSIDAKSALTSRVSTGGRVNAYKAIVNAKAQSGAAPWTPSYTPEYKSSRSIASESAASPVAGCGLVKAIMSNNSGGGAGGSSATDLIVILCMVSLPLVVALRLRSKQSVQAPSLSRRTTERYDVSKKASIQLSNQTIDITTQDLSMGGISFKADTALAKGQIVKLKFNDSEAEQVEAEVVWCSKTKEYGLKFLNISESIKFEIQSWTQGLVPTN